MHKKIIAAIITGVGIIGTMAFLGSRGATVRPASYHAILVSVSDSDACGCECVVGIAEDILNRHDSRRNLIVELFRTGDNHTALEPVMVDTFRVIARSRAMDVGEESAKQQRRELLSAIQASCQQKMPTTRTSPIYLDTKSVVEHLVQYGCGTAAECRAWIKADLEETEEGGIVDSLARIKKSRPLPSQIANKNIAVTFCGLAQTVGQSQDSKGRITWKTRKRDAQHVDLLKQLWPRLFTDPALVEVRDFCPQFSGGSQLDMK
jgi:hypothetical protein